MVAHRILVVHGTHGVQLVLVALALYFDAWDTGAERDFSTLPSTALLIIVGLYSDTESSITETSGPAKTFEISLERGFLGCDAFSKATVMLRMRLP
jgi:hypothetical protein